MFFYIVVGVVMAASFVGMIICKKKQAEFPAAQPLTIALLVLVLGCAVAIIAKSMSGSTKTMIAGEMTYNNASATVFGRYLAAEYPGSSALVIVEDKNSTDEFYLARMAALKEGLGEAVKIVAVETPDVFATSPVDAAATSDDPSAPPAASVPPLMITPVTNLMLAEHFDVLIDQNPGCQLIITMIGLPRDVDNLKMWAMPEETRPKVAMYSSGSTGISQYMEAIAAGSICVALTYSPDAKFDLGNQLPPTDPQAAFDQRYLLITPANLEEIKAKYPGRIFAQ